MSSGDLDGAKAAAQYYLNLYPYVLSAVSKSKLKAMSDPDCIFCAAVIKKVEERKKAGTHDLGGAMAYSDVGGHAVTDKSFFVTLTVTQGPSRTVDKSGAMVKDYPDTVATDVSLVLHRVGSRWVVREATLENSRKA